MLRRRNLVENGESQITSTFRDSSIEEQAARCLVALDLSGPVVMQAIVTENQDMKVIECNSRFGGASTTAITAGLDIFYWSLQEALGIDSENYSFNRIDNEIRQIRVPSDIYVIDYGANL